MPGRSLDGSDNALLASPDPAFEAKEAEIIGLHLAPPKHAVVFCVDDATGHLYADAITYHIRCDYVLVLRGHSELRARVEDGCHSERSALGVEDGGHSERSEESPSSRSRARPPGRDDRDSSPVGRNDNARSGRVRFLIAHFVGTRLGMTGSDDSSTPPRFRSGSLGMTGVAESRLVR
jgi:hypothetical protein